MRNFDISDILSVTTGRLVSTRHMAGLCDILNYMTGDDLSTHAIPRAGRECEPFLLEQHPQLKNVDASSVTPDNWQAWLAEQRKTYGDELPVAPLPKHAHEFIDPMSELAEKVHPDRIVTVRVGD